MTETGAMRLGLVGLGRMGAGIAGRLRSRGFEVVAFDADPARSEAASLGDLVAKLAPPRAVWVMVPAGEATEATIDALANLLAPGDILVDGGNSYHKDSVRRGEALEGRGISFLDAGTSGGIWGEANGFCLMVGGAKEAFAALEPVFAALAADGPEGYVHAGPVGAGHYAKMVHNGIEYGMMQALAEGFDLLQAAPEYGYDLKALAHLWNHGSVIRSWLVELAERALAEDATLESLSAYADDSGEGRWTVIEGVERGVNVGVLSQALFARFTSRQEQPFAMRMIAALRQQFGGHAVRPSGG